ncbi:MAG: CMP-binding protein, partial [Thermoguttaceae bacterium]|nr:CMP-binding protein [Thermoguttaceae bacterium]
IAETERLTATEFDPELAMLLTHLIISHHGTLENGSAKVPMTLEALALYYIDSLDAKLAEFHRNLREDVNSDSHWTNYIPGLDRKLYKNKS